MRGALGLAGSGLVAIGAVCGDESFGASFAMGEREAGCGAGGEAALLAWEVGAGLGLAGAKEPLAGRGAILTPPVTGSGGEAGAALGREPSVAAVAEGGDAFGDALAPPKGGGDPSRGEIGPVRIGNGRSAVGASSSSTSAAKRSSNGESTSLGVSGTPVGGKPVSSVLNPTARA